MPLVFPEGGIKNRWRRVESKALGVAAEIHMPTVDEWAEYNRRFRLSTEAEDIAGARRYVAQHWTRAFEGLQREDGSPHPDTADVRALVFNEIPPVWTWVRMALLQFMTLVQEGNGDSASAS